MENIYEESEKLLKDYLKYKQEVSRDHPDLKDREIFEGWMIHQVAALQALINGQRKVS